MLKNNKVLYLLIFLLSFGIVALISPLRGEVLIGNLTGKNASSLTALFVYFMVTYILLYKLNNKLKPFYIFLAMFWGLSFIQLPVRVFENIYYKRWGLSDIDYLVHALGIVLPYITYKVKNIFKPLIIILGFSLGIWLSIYGNDMWCNKISYGSFTGKVDNKIKFDLKFQTIVGDTMSINNFRGKYVILDCWYTYCGICYKELPRVQRLYKKYKDNKSVMVYALHCRMEDENEGVNTGAEILKKRGFDIASLSINIEDKVLQEQINISCYPTVLIFNKEGKLIFMGGIELADRMVDSLAY